MLPINKLSAHNFWRIISRGGELICTLMCHPATARKWGRIITLKPQPPDVNRTHLSNDEMKQLFKKYLTLQDEKIYQ